jgi:hypothetical protein
MILFTILLFTLIILAVVTIAFVSVFGAGFIVIFGDVIICGVIIGRIMKAILKKRKSKK